MFLTEIELKSYRNYEALKKKWNPGINILLGFNAQGKTNLLESIYILSMAKSHRTSKDKEWIQFGKDFAKIKAKIERKTGPTDLELTITEQGKKAKINGIEQRKLSSYIGTLNVVIFAPEDLDLVKGSPSIRRRFLDMEIGQVSPAYLYNLNTYNKILLQRNQLLKEINKKEKNSDLLDIWDDQFIEYGLKVLFKRIEFLDKLTKWARNIHWEISHQKETLKIEYQCSITNFQKEHLDQVKELFLSQLKKIREKEIQRGASLIGPHRDDLIFSINEHQVHNYGSQGQQRTTALSLKLAEIELINQEIGEYPILLLDDVFSELDENRQNQLLSGFKDKCQIFVTTTSIDGIPKDTLEEADTFWIQSGTIEDKER